MACENKKFMQPCHTCGLAYQFGPGRYEGVWLEAYGIRVCDGCELGNQDGWHPSFEPRLNAILKDDGLPLPDRLPNGLLPFNPPVPR